MFNVRIIYDEAIDNEYFPESVGIICINCGNIIGCYLANKNMEDFITPFVTNMVFQKIGLFWIIRSNKNLNFDFQNHYLSWILNAKWYNTAIFSRLHDLVFEDYFTTYKREKYNITCSIEAYKKSINKSTRTNLLMMKQVVVVPDHFHKIQ